MHSLTLPRIAEWLCSSMMPGATCLPAASITTASCGRAQVLADRRDLAAASPAGRRPRSDALRSGRPDRGVLDQHRRGLRRTRAMRHASHVAHHDRGQDRGAAVCCPRPSCSSGMLARRSRRGCRPALSGGESLPRSSSSASHRSKSSTGSAAALHRERAGGCLRAASVAQPSVSAPTTSFTVVSLSASTEPRLHARGPTRAYQVPLMPASSAARVVAGAVHPHLDHLALLGEQLAAGHGEVGDLAGRDGADAGPRGRAVLAGVVVTAASASAAFKPTLDRGGHACAELLRIA